MPLLAVAVAILAGCAGPDATGPARVVDDFARAVAAGDGDAACDLLLPDAASALEESAGEPCPQAVVEPTGPFTETIADPDRSDVEEVHVAGRQAQVVTASDTYFLARSGEGWVLTAAACRPRPERPYDCGVEA